MVDPVPALVTLHVWRVRRYDGLAAMLCGGLDRASLRQVPGLRFARLLGTARAGRMAPHDADLRRWALLSCWESADAATRFEAGLPSTGWRGRATERWRAELLPLSAHGRWARREPFGRPVRHAPDGPVAVLTRARLAPRTALRFWQAARPVAATLSGRAGLRLALGIGEAPLGLQGTFSVWDSPEAMTDFAYRSAEHATVLARSRAEHWYSEELFARFAVVAATGTVDGRDPLR